MRVLIIRSEHCACRAEIPAAVEALKAMGHEVEVVDQGAASAPIRTVPSLVLIDDALGQRVLDVEVPEDMSVERVTFAINWWRGKVEEEMAAREAAAQGAAGVEPTDVEVRLRALEMRLGPPTEEEKATAREALVSEAVAVAAEEVKG